MEKNTKSKVTSTFTVKKTQHLQPCNKHLYFAHNSTQISFTAVIEFTLPTATLQLHLELEVAVVFQADDAE